MAEAKIAAGEWIFSEVEGPERQPVPLGHYSINPPLSIPGEAYDTDS
jgi:hypothetical protein